MAVNTLMWLAVVLALATLLALVILRIVGTSRDFGTRAERATYETLHTVWSAAPPLRAGLVPDTARRAAKSLRELLDIPALALTDDTRMLAWDGAGGDHHADHVLDHAKLAMDTGRTQVLRDGRVTCAEPDCQVRSAVIAPLVVDGSVLGALIAYGGHSSASLARATNELARFVSGQLELAEFDRSKRRLIEAEVRALRAQISPHFIFNSLTVIASFVRTDQERARRLLLDFADFTRYSFRRHGDFTTLADELRSIDQYLTLQRARFGERLTVTLEVAPEVLPVAVPFLCLQPLVENAVRHGLEGRPGAGHITITAADSGLEAHITIEDDGVGMDPEKLRRILGGDTEESAGIGLGNVDERLRQVYGDEYGLVVETAPGAGAKIHVRVPKYRAGVHAG
ncbi:sensor histidine kinase [Solihabitans fulvus]|uniref:histidine kinase n=1 Tax=Solihabitans fulvus TaxID=1892852 RepID=A0A5B2XCX1_9PSEU|nr:histidine kinase [Solihabitans fulvus]KAA2261507.1 sensor histidine kinase [Solihabitans fulvus]